jgi:hypothetical protein
MQKKAILTTVACTKIDKEALGSTIVFSETSIHRKTRQNIKCVRRRLDMLVEMGKLVRFETSYGTGYACLDTCRAESKNKFFHSLRAAVEKLEC